MPVAVFGADGQIGHHLCALLGPQAVPLTRTQVDLSQPDTIASLLEAMRPSAVINAAAYTQVDKAETETDIVTFINADAPAVMAEYCKKAGIPFVHYSTDYVFDGSGSTPWKEGDTTGPLNAYGRTKLESERRIQDAGGDYLIFRTSWVYDAAGANFLNTMLRLGAERETLRVVNDQHGAPCYAKHLAEATLQVLDTAQRSSKFQSGIYHMANAGETTWYGFANAIFTRARTLGIPLAVQQLNPIPSEAYPTPAMRPKNSRLDCGRLKAIFGVALPTWEDGLASCMEVKIESLRRTD